MPALFETVPLNSEDRFLNLLKPQRDTKFNDEVVLKALELFPLPAVLLDFENWDMLFGNTAFRKAPLSPTAFPSVAEDWLTGLKTSVAKETASEAQHDWEFPWTSPSHPQQTWLLKVLLVQQVPKVGLVFMQNIQAQRNLQGQNKVLQDELDASLELVAQKNLALRELGQFLDQKNVLGLEFFERQMENVIHPLIEKLKSTCTERESLRLVKLLEDAALSIKRGSQNLDKEVAYPTCLSPKEIKICELIRQDLTSKQIADLLNLTTPTIDFHRRNIRLKLGLNEKGDRLSQALRNL